VTSLTEKERLERLQKYLELWQQLSAGARRSGEVSDEEREQKLIDRMIPIAAPEISGAFHEDFAARVFCDLFSIDDAAAGEEQVLAVIPKGLKHAGHTFAENRSKPVGEHIKSCIAAELASLRDKRIVEAQNKSPEELLSVVLDWPRPNVMVLLEHLTFEQRDGLLELLVARVGRSLVVSLKDKPEDELRWRIWYTLGLQAYDAKLSEVLREDTHPIFVPVGEVQKRPPPKGVNPAGPMHARFYQQLVEELREAGRDIQDPDSKSRIARLTGLDRRAIGRYLDSDVQVEIALGEQDRVKVRFRLKDLQRSIDVSRGKKRGRKTRGS